MNWLKEKWLSFWHNHVQKTFGTIIATLGAVDLVSAIAGADHYVVTLVGEKWNAAIHLISGIIVATRASLVKK